MRGVQAPPSIASPRPTLRPPGGEGGAEGGAEGTILRHAYIKHNSTISGLLLEILKWQCDRLHQQMLDKLMDSDVKGEGDEAGGTEELPCVGLPASL